jgi:hypothetical protein
MDFDLDTLAADSSIAAVISEIRDCHVPTEEPVEVRARRIAEHQERESRDRDRRAADHERYVFEQARERERLNQAARAAAQAEIRERYEQQRRERNAQHDRDRLAHLEAQQRAEQARQAQAARAQAQAAHWAEIDALIEGFGRMVNPPPPDITSSRIAELEAALEHQAQEQAFAAEARRRAAYQERQRAAVARRESGGW